MSRQPVLLLLLAASALGSPAGAHHSAAPHYVLEETIEVAGVVEAWRLSNPHSLLTLKVEGLAEPETWVCETDGVSFVRRSGLERGDIQAGARVTLTASPGRNDPTICLMRTITLEDGRTFDFRGGGARRQAEDAPEIAQNSSIYGVWTPGAGPPRGSETRLPATGEPGVPLPQKDAEPTADAGDTEESGGAQPGVALASYEPLLEYLTEAGLGPHAAYDVFRDDPALRCSPVSQRRLWNAVGTPLSIRREGETVILAYEFMDGVRTVHLDQTAPPPDAERTLLGYSVGRFEGDTLVVETSHHTPGVLLQYVLDDKGELRGLLRSEEFTLSERIRFLPESRELEVVYTYEDPLYFVEGAPWPTLTRYYRTADAPLEIFNCVPDVVELAQPADSPQEP